MKKIILAILLTSIATTTVLAADIDTYNNKNYSGRADIVNVFGDVWEVRNYDKSGGFILDSVECLPAYPACESLVKSSFPVTQDFSELDRSRIANHRKLVSSMVNYINSEDDREDIESCEYSELPPEVEGSYYGRY